MGADLDPAGAGAARPQPDRAGDACRARQPAELKLHVKGALANGVTREEIKEVLLQGCIYAGIPAGLEAFKAAVETFKEIDAAKP